MDFAKQILEKIKLESLIPYLDNTVYLIAFLVVLTLLIEIIDTENIKANDDNDFIDVLAAIEEEMAAVRELYVGGYISKGVYITETDRLYEKAKIFGL